jgi:putative flippase GtrA
MSVDARYTWGMAELGGNQTKQTRPLMRAGFALLGLAVLISIATAIAGGSTSPMNQLTGIAAIVLIVVGRFIPPTER